MSRRWLLSLLCLSVSFLSLVQLTRARGVFKVNETTTRILLNDKLAEVMLVVENSTGETLNASIQLELLDPQNKSRASTSGTQSIGVGSQKLSLPLPFSFSNLNEKEKSEFLWYRLHYRVSENGSTGNTITEGIVSLSEITPDLFELRVATSGLAREKGRYYARVKATHPITGQPAAGVRLDSEITLEDDDGNIKLRASKTTDSKGFAALDFAIPPRFPQFPHTVRPAGGQIKVVGTKGAIVAATEGQVVVDQFARILLSTDKPLYQPGQIMHLRALLFTPSMRALANQSTFFKVADPEGITVFQTTANTTRFGVVNADWSIPENTRLGDYRIFVGVDGGDDSSETSIEVRVSRYDLPNFKVNVETDRPYYLPGQNATVKVRADYLFGKPVGRGRVRVVRENGREWNHQEQKWEIDEGEKFEGETDASGVFVAHINLANDHEKAGDYSRRFTDATYAAYFTDPTTNRTEQRRFDLRATIEPIHVYVIEKDEWVQNKALPLKFFVSTFYADGTPARCSVKVEVSDESSDQKQTEKRPLATLRTNRYGLGKVSGVRLPSEFVADKSRVELLVSAVDSKGRKGSGDEGIYFWKSGQEVRIETDKTLYRPGEPFTAFVSSSGPEQNVTVDVLRDSSVIRSQRVKLHDGRGSVVFTYKPEFNDRLTIVAYGDSRNWGSGIGSHSILYPRPPDLDVKARAAQDSYRPGEEAVVNVSVRSAEGRLTESALGVVVFDTAVEERFRTAREFGSPSYGTASLVERFLGLEEQIAGVSVRDLRRLDMSKAISPDLDLLAAVLLNEPTGFFPTFHGGDQYANEPEKLFGDYVKEQLKPVREALASRYARTAEYPRDEASLRRFLSDSKIDFDTIRDPWGTPYRPSFSLVQNSDDLALMSAGADKRFNTGDDFFAERMGWPYFRLTGQMIDKAVDKYYDHTGDFIRDLAAFREALTADGLNPDQMHDRWGKPYRFEFDLNRSNYEISVRSGGPDQKFSAIDNYSHDDFIIWKSSINYFEKTRSQIEGVLKQNTKGFPETEEELRAALRGSRGSLETLRDPWRRPYYVTFKTETLPADRFRVENQPNFGDAAPARVAFSPAQTVRFISVRSTGPDGKQETRDDFSVAILTTMLTEGFGGNAASRFVVAGSSGWIQGVVTDPNGAVVAQTTVIARSSGGERTYQTTTDENGKYTFHLPPGMYELQFDAIGFKTSIYKELLVHASYVTEVNVGLEVGAATETVSVMAAPGQTLSTNAATSTTERRSISPHSLRMVTKSGSSEQMSTPRLREYFPETLVWQPSIETDKQGRARINFKLADNITTWKLLVVGSTEDGQLGMTEKEIKAFQPFFVEHDPPRVLTEGDEISLPVTVRNYLPRPQKVDLEIKPENWFSLVGPTRKQINVAAGDANRETFDLRAIATIKDGKQRITAFGSDDSDAIEKPVTVYPDGEERSVTDEDIMADRTVLELDVPQNVISNSLRAELKIYPNLMAHVIEGVEGIMQRPYGCGEQTISSTYPSLLLLRHYKQAGGHFPLRARAERYLKEGYSRLLNYRDDSGGFTYWGNGEPNLALTAYALRFLSNASEVIAVDEEVIKEARKWLVKRQQHDGSWGPDPNNTTLTVYIARVLADSSETVEAAKKAVAYLEKRFPQNKDPYVLSSHALVAIAAGDPAGAQPVIEKLRRLSKEEGSTLYWSLEANTPFHGWGTAGDVETTALAIQAISKFCEVPGANCSIDPKMINRTLMYLLKEKDRYGVWFTTQATINALDALLLLFSKQPAVQGSSGETQLSVNGRPVQTLQIPVVDRLVTPITLDLTQFLSAGKNRLEFRRPDGSPLATVQAVANFYVPWSETAATNNQNKGLRLQVKFERTEGRINDEIVCHVETQRVDLRGSGMLLAEIGLPPGADVDRSSLQEAVTRSNWTISEYDVLPDRVVVYLWPRSEAVKFKFKFRPRFGLNAKTAPSSVYDYYNPESRAGVAPVTFKVR